MSGNFVWFRVTDVVALDQTPQAGTTTNVTVKFEIDDPWCTFFGNATWPYTAKVYLEGFGGRPEANFQTSANLAPGACGGTRGYEIVVPVTMAAEGVYEVAALVELDNAAGFIMAYYQGDYKISFWTPV